MPVSTDQQQFPPPPSHPAGIPRERDMPQQQPQTTVIRPVMEASGAAFVPFGKRPLEFVTCFKVPFTVESFLYLK